AIAAILGDRLTAVIVESESACREAITLLKNEKGGRATLLALDLSSTNLPEYDLPESISTDISFIGKAIDLVSVADERHDKSIKRLLSGALVVSDLSSAISMTKNCATPFRFVTLTGDIVEPDGTVSGGSAMSGGGASIVARKRIVSELAKQGKEAEQKIQILEEKIGVISKAIEQIDLELETCMNEQQNIDMDLFAVTKEIEQISVEIINTDNAARSAKNEIAQIGEENRSLSQRKEEIDRIKETSLASRSQIEEVMANLETQIEKTSADLASRNSALGEEEIALTQLKGNLENINADMSRLASSLADLTRRKDRLAESQVDSGRRKNEITQSIDDLLRENVDLALKKEKIGARIVERTESLAQTIKRREEIETEIKSLDVELSTLRESVSELSMNRSEVTVRLENCLEKSDTEFNIPEEDLDTFDLEQVDISAAEQRLRFLRSELSRIGAVNMSALDEFDEVNERFEHMKSQHDDLVKSVANLRKTIDSINSTTRKLFDEAFKEIAANFEVVFVKLFGGGRAEMRLVQDDEENAEPGVEIIVQPPGKKVSHLNLLSAGEKAMTAISLLFAIFLRQPSPFCLLDEVDAPLDEANIFRFRDILDTLKERTQFIVITHSQKTMSFADRLYGVTQEEQGVSKILGVDLHDHRHDDYTVTAA
ncbi:Chromosome partition protein smc, partial [hydrothermal vent metagenome]